MEGRCSITFQNAGSSQGWLLSEHGTTLYGTFRVLLWRKRVRKNFELTAWRFDQHRHGLSPLGAKKLTKRSTTELAVCNTKRGAFGVKSKAYCVFYC